MAEAIIEALRAGSATAEATAAATAAASSSEATDIAFFSISSAMATALGMMGWTKLQGTMPKGPGQGSSSTAEPTVPVGKESRSIELMLQTTAEQQRDKDRKEMLLRPKNLENVPQEFAEIRTELAEFRTELTGVRTELTEIRTELTGIGTELTGVRTVALLQIDAQQNNGLDIRKLIKAVGDLHTDSASAAKQKYDAGFVCEAD